MLPYPDAYDFVTNLKQIQEMYKGIYGGIMNQKQVQEMYERMYKGNMYTTVTTTVPLKDIPEIKELEEENKRLFARNAKLNDRNEQQARTIQELQNRVDHLKTLNAEVGKNARTFDDMNEKAKNEVLALRSQVDVLAADLKQTQKLLETANHNLAFEGDLRVKLATDVYEAMKISGTTYSWLEVIAKIEELRKTSEYYYRVLDEHTKLKVFKSLVGKAYESFSNVGAGKG